MPENTEKTQKEKERGSMLYYLAPMEELTGYVYRNVYQENYAPMDKYFTPFLSPTQKKILKTREQKDVAPENNTLGYTVPQILTNDVEGFFDTVYYLLSLDYHEINLNFGCPSGTVVSKGKGAGMLKDPDSLDCFLEIIFDAIYKEGLDSEIFLSVKSRLGMEEEWEWEDILKVYNRYPIYELILHPRFQKQLYGGKVHRELFQYTLENSLHPVCYNGDIFCLKDYLEICRLFPTLDRVMLGRGILANPGLMSEILEWEESKDFEKANALRLQPADLAVYHQNLYDSYVKELGNEKDAMFKCKEIWYYLAGDMDALKERNYLNIKKAKNPAEYRNAVNAFWQARL